MSAGWGTPRSGRMVIPPIEKDGEPPVGNDRGTPNPHQEGWGYPQSGRMEVCPPPHWPDGGTPWGINRQILVKTQPPVILRIQAVIKQYFLGIRNNTNKTLFFEAIKTTPNVQNYVFYQFIYIKQRGFKSHRKP